MATKPACSAPLSPFKGMVYWYIRLALAKAVCFGIGGYIDPPPGQGTLVVCLRRLDDIDPLLGVPAICEAGKGTYLEDHPS